MHQQLWGYKVKDKLYLWVREQKRLNTTDLETLTMREPKPPWAVAPQKNKKLTLKISILFRYKLYFSFSGGPQSLQLCCVLYTHFLRLINSASV
jgi:hypothetical protein